MCLTNKITDHDKSKWTTEQEILLAKWADKALCYRWLHDLSEKKYTRLNTSIQIPVIVLSTVIGALNVGIDSIFPASVKQYANIGLGGVSMLTAVITTIGNFLRYAQNMEGHRVASIQWSKFHRNISAEVAIHPELRQDSAEFFSICRAELDRLVEQSPTIPDDIIKLFEERFSDTNISKPEVCNILEPTTIYKPHDSSDNWLKTTDKKKKKEDGGIFKSFYSKKSNTKDEDNKDDLNTQKPPDFNTDDETIITFDNNSPKNISHAAIIDSINK